MKYIGKQFLAKLLAIDFVRFCIVGASGFVINFGLLTILYKVAGWPIFVSQLLSAEVALFSNFLLHNHWTYKYKKVYKSISTLLWQFHASSWVAIVGSAALVSMGINQFQLNYFLALVVSSVIALLWNFVWTKYIIWRQIHEGAEE